MTELQWVAQADEASRRGMHALVASVAGLGGAVGWLDVPDHDETDRWLDGVLRTGARVVVARVGDRLVGCGYWARLAAPVMRQNAGIHKVMTLPSARGTGVARAVTAALIEDAEQAGVEALAIDCRGNNHAALALYTSLGFVVTGRRPDWIAVGNERFDQVLLHLDLRPRRPFAAGLVRHGGRREGPGNT